MRVNLTDEFKKNNKCFGTKYNKDDIYCKECILAIECSKKTGRA